MERGDGIELLLDVGLDRRVTGSAEVEISTGADSWSRRKVLLLRHSPSPQEITRALATLRPPLDGILFVVAHAGRSLTRAAERDPRIAYAAVDDALVSYQGALRRSGEKQPTGSPHPRRPSWVRLGMLRLFALGPVEPLSQSKIARRLGVSHVAVGKQLPLPNELVGRTPLGWQAIDRAGCWDRFMSDYPGPGGIATYWAATGDLATQLDRIERVVSELSDTSLSVSGDLASDFYAPWRRPSRVIAYVNNQPPLQEHRFATVPTTDATVELHTPTDPTIQITSREFPSPHRGGTRRYTDPLITAWDLRRSPGGDVTSAIDQLRERALREPLWS